MVGRGRRKLRYPGRCSSSPASTRTDPGMDKTSASEGGYFSSHGPHILAQFFAH